MGKWQRVSAVAFLWALAPGVVLAHGLSTDAQTLTVELPGMAPAPFAVTATDLGPGMTGYRGESADGSRLALFVGPRNTWGTVWAPEGRYRFVQGVDGGRWVAETELVPATPFTEQVLRSSAAESTAQTGTKAEADDYMIDVLLLYSSDFVSAWGGTQNAHEKLRYFNFLANDFLANSAVPLTYRIVAMERYDPGQITTMDDFRYDPEVIERRNRHGADAVVQFTTSACSGFATAFNSGQETPDGSEPEFVDPEGDGFAVVNQDLMCREDTYAHELGHIVGADHDFSASGTLSWKSYAHGWSCGDAGGGVKYASVMSYGQNRGEAGGDFFSSLDVVRQGEVCGSDGPTEAQQADNVRAMKQAIPYVVNYRSARSTGDIGSGGSGGGGGGGGAPDGSSGAIGLPALLWLAVLGLLRAVGQRMWMRAVMRSPAPISSALRTAALIANR